jgi:hypothetical protein
MQMVVKLLRPGGSEQQVYSAYTQTQTTRMAAGSSSAAAVCKYRHHTKCSSSSSSSGGRKVGRNRRVQKNKQD